MGGANHHPVNSPSGLRDILLSSVLSSLLSSMLPRRDHRVVAKVVEKEVEVEVEVVVEEEDGSRRSRGIVLPAADVVIVHDVVDDDNEGCGDGGSPPSSSLPASYNSVLGRRRRSPPRHRVDGGGEGCEDDDGSEDDDGIDRSNGGCATIFGVGVGAMMMKIPTTMNDATAFIASFAMAPRRPHDAPNDKTMTTTTTFSKSTPTTVVRGQLLV